MFLIHFSFLDLLTLILALFIYGAKFILLYIMHNLNQRDQPLKIISLNNYIYWKILKIQENDLGPSMYMCGYIIR